jgi:hypothetical protein
MAGQYGRIPFPIPFPRIPFPFRSHSVPNGNRRRWMPVPCRSDRIPFPTESSRDGDGILGTAFEMERRDSTAADGRTVQP